MIYTVKNQVVENPQLVYNEGVTRIFLYTDGEIRGNEPLHTLLRFIKQTNESNAVDAVLDESYKEGYYSGLKGSHPDKPVGSLSKHRSNTLLIAK